MCGHPSNKGGKAPSPPGGGSVTPPKGQDTTKPKVVITSPRNNASVSGTLVTVNATATDSGGVKYATVRVNGAPRGTLTTGPYTFKVRLSKGTHSIVVEAMDKTGNIGKATVKVTANVIGVDISGSGPFTWSYTWLLQAEGWHTFTFTADSGATPICEGRVYASGGV